MKRFDLNIFSSLKLVFKEPVSREKSMNVYILLNKTASQILFYQNILYFELKFISFQVGQLVSKLVS